LTGNRHIDVGAGRTNVASCALLAVVAGEVTKAVGVEAVTGTSALIAGTALEARAAVEALGTPVERLAGTATGSGIGPVTVNFIVDASALTSGDVTLTVDEEVRGSSAGGSCTECAAGIGIVVLIAGADASGVVVAPQAGTVAAADSAGENIGARARFVAVGAGPELIADTSSTCSRTVHTRGEAVAAVVATDTGTAVGIGPVAADGVRIAGAGAGDRVAETVTCAGVGRTSRALEGAVGAHVSRQTGAGHCSKVANTIPEADIGRATRAAPAAVRETVADDASAGTSCGRALTQVGAGGDGTTGADTSAGRAPVAIEATANTSTGTTLRAHTVRVTNRVVINVEAGAGVLAIGAVLSGIAEVRAL